MRKTLVAFILFLTLTVSNVLGDVPFQLEFTFTVPGLAGAIKQVRFNDLDSDGFPEVLATDGHRLVLYSIAADSLLFGLAVGDTAEIGSILFADVNRDSVPDIVAIFDGLGAEIEVLDGSSGFQSKSALTIPRHQSAIGGCYPGPDLLYAGDIDSDGLNELLISAEVIQGAASFDQEGTIGGSYLYWSFPDSLIWSRGTYFDNAYPCPLASSHGGVWLRGSTCYYFSHGGFTSKGVDKGVFFLQSNDSIAVPQLPLLHLCDSTPLYQRDQHDFSASRIDPAPGGGTTLLTVAHSYFGCPAGLSDQLHESLNLYRISSPTTITPVWSIDLGSSHYANFIFPSIGGGYILAFRGDSLIMFREMDGSIRSIIPGVPAGQRSWEFPLADGVERLVIRNGQTVSIYHFDIATDIAGPEQATVLPFSFALLQPYPNPFNAQLSVPVAFTGAGHVDVAVYNLLGQKVAQLYAGRTTRTEMVFTWNAEAVSSGIYLLKVSSVAVTKTAKIILLK